MQSHDIFTGDDATKIAARVRAMLPASARAKIKARDEARDKARAEERGREAINNEKKERLRASKGTLAFQIGQLEKHRERGQVWTEDNEADLKSLKEELAEVSAELTALSAPKPVIKIPPAERRRNAVIAALAPRFEDWILSLDGYSRFVESKVDTTGETLESVRAKLDSIVDRLLALETAPLSADVAIAAMKKELDRAEAKGAPDISGLLAYRVRQLGGPPRQGGIKWPEASIYRAAIDGFEGVPLGTHFAVWLNRAAVEKKLTAMIREKLGDKEGVSAEDRAAEESALRSDAIRLMRIEAALCDEAEALGETVERRRLHPEAWLGIAPGKPALASSRQTGGMAMPAGSPVTVGVKVTAPTAKAAAAAKK